MGSFKEDSKIIWERKKMRKRAQYHSNQTHVIFWPYLLFDLHNSFTHNWLFVLLELIYFIYFSVVLDEGIQHKVWMCLFICVFLFAFSFAFIFWSFYLFVKLCPYMIIILHICPHFSFEFDMLLKFYSLYGTISIIHKCFHTGLVQSLTLLIKL